MKRILIGMVVLLIIGVAVCGAGFYMYKTSDNQIFNEPLEYTQMEYTSEEAVNAIEFSLSGDYNVIFKRGETCSLSYSQSEISNVTVAIENGVLKMEEKIDWKNRVKKWYCKRQKTDLILTLPEDVKLSMNCDFSEEVTLVLPDWEFGDIDMKLSGATHISTESEITAGNVSLNVSGYCSVDMKGEFQIIDVKASGAANMKINGSAQSFNLNSSGATSLSSDNLSCSEFNVKSSGTSNISLSGEGDSFVAKVSGHCRLDAGNFTLNTLDIDASGAVNMTVNVKDLINANASGAVKVNYYGDPRIATSGSANSKFNKIG
ncbi:MAG: DUF2807 domain-containing protein [Clostridia bacterium]|nr:DUF2807 domain-containing protein [Clostridia bacterium]